jgi:hypothetical protein
MKEEKKEIQFRKMRVKSNKNLQQSRRKEAEDWIKKSTLKKLIEGQSEGDY